MSLASNVASVLLITGSHHYTFYILYLVHFVQREIILDFVLTSVVLAMTLNDLAMKNYFDYCLIRT